MPTNEIKTFAAGGGANVISQAAYEALTVILANGFTGGIAESAKLNKVWRQSSFMAAVLAQFIVDKSGQDVLDNGDVAALVTKLTAAVNAMIASGVPDATTTVKGKVELATNAEAAAGTDTQRAVTPAGVAAAIAGTVSGYALLGTAQLFTKAQGCANAGVTDAATITPDFAASNNLSMILGGNRTLGLPANIVAGKSYRLDVWQPQAGNCLLALAWCYQTSNGAGITLSTSGCARDKLFLDVSVYAQSAVTISVATPGEITWPGHNLATGQRVQITTTGALPTGLAANTSYYVIVKDDNTLWLASSLTNAAAGTKIATSGAQSGVHTMTACTIDVAVKRAFS